jgi:hypothetical protein
VAFLAVLMLNVGIYVSFGAKTMVISNLITVHLTQWREIQEEF